MTDATVAQSAPEDLTKLTLPHLYDLQQLCAADTLRIKERYDAVKAEIGRRYSSSAAAAFVQDDKTHGTKTLPLQGGIEMKAEIEKKVEWDSEKLLAVAQTLPWVRVGSLFKIVFSVPEAAYKGIVTAAGFGPDAKAFKDKVDEARTVKFGLPKVTLQKVDG